VIPIGDHVYPFSSRLPASLPSTYNGSHGGIYYYSTAKLYISGSVNKSEKKYFILENLIDLNKVPELNVRFLALPPNFGNMLIFMYFSASLPKRIK